MKLSITPKFREFIDAPFDFVDNLNLKFLGMEWNFLKSDRKFRKIVFLFTILIFGIWMIAGWDSCQSQFEFVVVNLPDYFMGKLTWDDLVFIYNDQYGKGMHYSAWVIYGLMTWALCRYYDEKLGLRGVRNTSLAISFVLLSVGFFENFWHYSFGIFQNQPWVLKWQIPQLKILLQNLSFEILGILMIVAISLKDNEYYRIPFLNNIFVHIKTNMPQYKLRFNKTTLIFLLFTLGSIYVWYDYGNLFGYEPLEVEVIGYGTWKNTPHFPQTCYTIETDLTDNINAGVQFYVKDDFLHGVNTLAKVLLTLTFFNIGRVQKIDKK